MVAGSADKQGDGGRWHWKEHLKRVACGERCGAAGGAVRRAPRAPARRHAAYTCGGGGDDPDTLTCAGYEPGYGGAACTTVVRLEPERAAKYTITAMQMQQMTQGST